MSDRTVTLSTVKGGITRLRTKGAALNDTLYDLLNGYVTAARTVKVRPGTFRAFTLPDGTKGLSASDGRLNVYTSDPSVAGELTDSAALVDVTAHLVTHPLLQDDDGVDIALTQVHFAEKFMGFVYIAAEFDATQVSHGASLFHYWLQTGGVWLADNFYKVGDIASPTTFAGLYFQADRATASFPVWSPGAKRVIGDKVEPTKSNGFYFEVTEVFGDNPASGTAEPVWQASEGAPTYENTEAQYDGLIDAADRTNPTTSPAPTTVDRYA